MQLRWLGISIRLVMQGAAVTHKIQEHKQAKFPEAIAEARKWDGIGDINALLASRKNRRWSNKTSRVGNVISKDGGILITAKTRA